MKQNNFDLLRVFAALQVVFIHSLHHLKIDSLVLDKIKHFILLFPGVPIFFLISEFLISLSYERNPNIKDYTINRLLRIFPGLYVNILVSLFVLYYFGYLNFSFNFFKWLLAQLSIVQFYNFEEFRGFGVGVINGSLWTISVELTFYIVLPFLLFYFKKSQRVIIFLFLISFFIWIYDLDSIKTVFYNKLLHVTIIPYLFLFIIGILFYKFFNKIENLIIGRFLVWLIIYILYMYMIEFLNLSNFFIYFIKWLIFSFLVFSLAFSFRNLSKTLFQGNDYTYGIYIYHMIFINIFVHLNYIGSFNVIFLVFILSIASGYLSWHLIEKRFLSLKKHSLFKELHNK